MSQIRQTGTCTWLFGNETFKKWRSQDSGSLWLYGIRRSCENIPRTFAHLLLWPSWQWQDDPRVSSNLKSVLFKAEPYLRSAVIGEMQHDVTDRIALVYFYCDFRQSESTQVVTVLRTLVAEFIRAGWIEEVSKLSQDMTRGRSSPTKLSDLSYLLKKAVKFFQSSIIVIDALDECNDIEDLLPHLLDLAAGGDVKLFMTSRKERIIYEAFEYIPWISLKDESKSLLSDMEKHVSAELKVRSKLARLPTKLKVKISDTLMQKADGMYVVHLCDHRCYSDPRLTGFAGCNVNSILSRPAARLWVCSKPWRTSRKAFMRPTRGYYH